VGIRLIALDTVAVETFALRAISRMSMELRAKVLPDEQLNHSVDTALADGKRLL
jgi:hypothetical protein